MKLHRHVMLVLIVASQLFASEIGRAEERLSSIEHGDRFAYWHLLQSENLAQDVIAIANQSGHKEGETAYDFYVTIRNHVTSSSGLAILALERSTSKEAYRSLAYLTLLDLDGSVAEARSCAVLKKGRAMLPYFEEVRRAIKAGNCVMKELSKVKMKSGVCKSSEDAMNAVDSFVEDIKKGVQCNST